MDICRRNITIGREEVFVCGREDGHDGPHRDTESSTTWDATVEWTYK